jgi:hypothetical protein
MSYSLRFSMSRQDIGNFLGLAPETVSRLLGQLETRIRSVKSLISSILNSAFPCVFLCPACRAVFFEKP